MAHSNEKRRKTEKKRRERKNIYMLSFFLTILEWAELMKRAKIVGQRNSSEKKGPKQELTFGEAK